MFDKSHDISVLNSLIETTLDSIDGYRRSAEEASNDLFSAAFLDRATERQQVVASLQEEVRRLGGDPEDDGSVLAAAHRTFLSVRDAVTGGDDKSVLAEVDRGETYLRSKWETALGDERLSPETRQLISRCYESVRSGQEQWETVHRSMETGS